MEEHTSFELLPGGLGEGGMCLWHNEEDLCDPAGVLEIKRLS